MSNPNDVIDLGAMKAAKEARDKLTEALDALPPIKCGEVDFTMRQGVGMTDGSTSVALALQLVQLRLAEDGWDLTGVKSVIEIGPQQISETAALMVFEIAVTMSRTPAEDPTAVSLLDGIES